MTTFDNIDQARRAKSKPNHGLCNWFLLCKNKATEPVNHPILGDVQSCESCATFTRS